MTTRQLSSNGAKIACSILSAADRSNIIFRVSMLYNKEQGEFKDNVIKKKKLDEEKE